MSTNSDLDALKRERYAMRTVKPLTGVAALALVAACTQQEEPTVVAVEPIFDKYGNIVYMPPEAAAAPVAVDSGGGGGSVALPSTDSTTDDDDPEPGDDTGQNQNREQTQSNNENQNRNQNQSGN
jgi:hypothetical protein